jgi:hypothetical protein
MTIGYQGSERKIIACIGYSFSFCRKLVARGVSAQRWLAPCNDGIEIRFPLKYSPLIDGRDAMCLQSRDHMSIKRQWTLR